MSVKACGPVSRPVVAAAPRIDRAVDFWSREAEVQERSFELHAHHRLFVQDAGQPTLRPAVPADVLNAFGYGHGQLYVVTARGTTTAQSVNQQLTTRGDASWAQSLHRIDASGSKTSVRYTASPVDDVKFFLSFPVALPDGRPVEGVTASTLQPGGGTVVVEDAQEGTEWNLYQAHEWRGNSQWHISSSQVTTHHST